MSTVSGTSASSGSKSSVASNALSGNYELFLTLLTTQIQNQDPLDPLDSAEYTNQLVQYSSVEQSIQTNQYLETLVSAMESSRASSYVSYLGAEVTASGSTTMLEDSVASWDYSIQDDAEGTVEIRNASGALIFSDDLNLAKGSNTYYWDGISNSGTNSDDGAYTITFKMKDKQGQSEPVSTEISGVVDEVDLSSGDAILKIGTLRVPVSSVLTVSRAT
ncbi:flagellar hook assembly protein FlgD [Roseibium litorale]|uniref:Basal-body rod modification protein FlgD n=1 Tax=Roseibium litorale TaxID=2803841 RepID=A0ABR9CKF8_9HYPH|nr:flagellar hook capping FlgD N-terminal domain-containing protein [Roseibium litorale]MBD8891335.1 flagellar hook assembly protein FlgD [Roseibium litorale]